MRDDRTSDRPRSEVEEEYRLLVESMSDYAIFLLDPAGRITSWNPGARQTFGYDRDEILGQHFALLFPPEDRDAGAPAQELETAAATGQAQNIRWHLRKDGSLFWAIGTTVALRQDNQLRGYAKIARDRTDEFQAEEALRRNHDRLRLLHQVATDLVMDGEPVALMERVYHRLADHLGLEVYFHYLLDPATGRLRLRHYEGVPDALARRVEWLDVGQTVCGAAATEGRDLPATDAPRADDRSAELARSLGITAYASFPLLAHGRAIGMLSYGSRRRPAFDGEDLTLLQSVSDHVAIALERARLIAELEARARELAAADRRKDEFLAMLAHELRNPLAPIRNSTQLLQRLGPQDTTLVKARAVIDRQVTHLSRLVDDLLDVSRVTRGKIQLQRDTVDAAAVIARAVEINRPLVEARRHKLTVALPPGPLQVEGDSTRLAQVLGNLITNAAKYMDNGGEIAVSAGLEGEQVLFRVKDRGIGIPAEHLGHVFDLFTQVDRSIDRAQGGLGIGLALARSLVELHGGTVTAHSDGPGTGSEFVVRLPRGSVDGQPRGGGPHRPAAPAAPRPGRTVVVVDDNVDAAETLAVVLRADGHDVHTAHDGPAALAAVAAARPEVVILDIGLPQMDGYTVARRLRRDFPPGTMTIIALTGYGQEEDRQRSREAGFDAHLVKPVDLGALQDLLAGTVTTVR